LKNQATILIADRNPHIRDFLSREMALKGYRVCLAKSGREVLKWVSNHESIDLVILDLDLPDASEVAILEKLEDRMPTLPVVVHAFLSDHANHPAFLNAAAIVEKKGNSIERLNKVVYEILRKSKPEQFSVTKDNNQQKAKP